MSKWARGKTSRAIRALVLVLAVAGMDQALAAPSSGTMQSASGPSATMPTSGTCGFEINMILATGENLMNYQQAASLSPGSSSGLFALGLLGGFTFNGSSGGTFSVTEVDRSYTSASPSSPVTVDSTQLNSGTFALTPQTGSAVPGAMMMTLTMTGGGAGPVLLVMPVNGGNTLLIQDQTSGAGGGVCQF